MENVELLINAFVSVFSLIAILAIYFWPMRELRVDQYRQRLFDIRTELFLYASRDGIAFTHPAYQMLRTLFNGGIRASHRLSLQHLVVLFTWMSNRYPEWNAEDVLDKHWEEASRSLENGAREELEDFRRRLRNEIARFLFFGSNSKFLLFLPVILIIGLSFKAQKQISKEQMTTQVDNDDDRSQWVMQTSENSMQIGMD